MIRKGNRNVDKVDPMVYEIVTKNSENDMKP